MKLTLLTDNETYIAICTEYWGKNKAGGFSKTVSAIAKQFNTTTAEITKIIKRYCIAVSDDASCVVCGKEYPFKSRADYSDNAFIEPWTCNACKTQEADALWNKKYACISILAEQSLARSIDPHTLSARQMICLAALIRFGSDEEFSKILPYDTVRNIELTPSKKYDRVILEELYEASLIIVSPDSDLNRISLNENGGFSFYLTEVELLLPNPNPKGFVAAIEENLSTKEFRDSFETEIELFAKEIALQECLSYLTHVLGEHQLQYSPGEKTFLVLNKGLERYSVAQMYNFIWRAVKDAAAFYVRNRVSRDHAAKTVVANIERQIERSISNEWNVTAYRRNFDYPQSVLSRVLFNSVLKTDDGGFTKNIASLFGALKQAQLPGDQRNSNE